jgi:DNA helicase IV
LQPDQFKISRERVDFTLAIQGPPGSGKTVVLLERLSRVAFANPEIRSKGMLLIGPNVIFLDYISQVLPAKGKTDIELSTFEKLVSWKPTYFKESEEAKLIKGDTEIAKILEKAVLQSFRIIDKSVKLNIQKITIDFVPMDSILIIKRLEILDGIYFIKRGIAENYVRDLLVEKFMVKWSDQFGNEKSPKFDPGKLIVETKEFKSIVNRIAPNLKPLAVLNKLKTIPSYFYSLAKDVLSDEQIDLWVSNANTPTQKISVSDLPLLDYLEYLISASQRKWGHIAIDETQDLTPMQLRSIGLRFGPETTASLTGDLAQATGLFWYENWQDILEQFNIEMKSKITELTHSYRVPTEILNFANQFLESSGISVSPAVPFLDVADSLEKVILKERENFKTAAIRIIEKHLAADLSVLVIASETMKKEILAAPRNVPKDSLFRIMGPDEIKGLESDAVVIIDPVELMFEKYDGDSMEQISRRLYVMCTRSTKKLTLIGESEWDLEILLIGIMSKSWDTQ